MTQPSVAPEIDGNNGGRRCTDVVFTILIFAMWVALSIIGVRSYTKGDYKVMFYPMDYDGNVCGTSFGDVNMTEYPKIVYINNYLGGVCVNECPKIESLADINTFLTYNGVYQGENATLSADYVKVADYSDSEHTQVCNADDCPMDPRSSFLSRGVNFGNGFAYYAVDTFEVLHVRCISNPNAIEKVKDEVYIPDTNVLSIRVLDDTADFFGHLSGDIYTSNYYIFVVGFCGALALGFIYAQLLRFRFILGTVVWSSILITVGIIFCSAVYALHSARKWENHAVQIYHDNTIWWTKAFAYALFSFGIIVVFLLAYLRKEIQLAMACVKEAARAIGSMSLMIFFPFLQCLATMVFFAIWSFYAVHLASLGEVVSKELPTDAVVTVRHYKWDESTKRTGWYLIFCFFWTLAFISAIGEIIIAMSISRWYFSKDKNRIGSLTFLKSITASIYYHTGTAAFGSLLIAIVQIFRTVVTWVQKKSRALDNKLGEALLCCCQCCLWFFEKFIQFLSKNAFIQTAIFGTSFCESSKEAFELIMRNAKRVGSINYVSALVLFVGKVFISFTTAGITYVVIDWKLSSELYSATGPAVVVFIIAYYIGTMFLDIFEMSTSTILHCFIADEENHDGDECFADDELRQWFDNFEADKKEIRVIS